MAQNRVTINLNTAKIQGRVDKILEAYGPYISFQLQQELSKDQFDYPVDTYRNKPNTINPRLVKAGKRDIVDTGKLLNSQTEPQIKKGVLTIKWLAQYSKAVLEGNYIVASAGGSYTAPPRDWITPALKNQPFLPFFVKTWKQLAGKQ